MQLSLKSILLLLGNIGLLFGVWTWFGRVLPGDIAAVLVVVWFCGAACVADGIGIEVEHNWRRGLWQLTIVSIGGSFMFLVMLLVTSAWLFLPTHFPND